MKVNDGYDWCNHLCKGGTTVALRWCNLAPGGATWYHVALRGATGGTTLHHQVVPLFSMPADYTTEYRQGGATRYWYGQWSRQTFMVNSLILFKIQLDLL